MGKLHAPFRLFRFIRPISGASGRGSAQSDPDSRVGFEACLDFNPSRTGTGVCKYCTTSRSPADCRPDRTGPMRQMLIKWWLCQAAILFTGCVGSVCGGSCYAKTWLYLGAPRLQVSTKVSRTEVEGSVRRRSVSDDLQRLTADDSLKQIVAPPAPAGCGKCDAVEEPLEKGTKPDIMVPPTETTGCGQCIAPGPGKTIPLQGLPRAPGF
jgi:hypothetical protein